jgi:hypothetical protein
MEEITAWLRRFPHQIGIYDYPGHGAYQWIHGMEKRVKWYARNGIRTVYCCGTPLLFDGLFHHVIARQLWDPFVDTGELTAEYVGAMFGKAAGPIGDLLRLNDRIWDEQLGDPTRTPEPAARFEALFRRAEALAAQDEPIVRQRVWKNILIWLRATLLAGNPRKGPPATAEDVDAFRRRVLWYAATVQADAVEHKRSRNTWMVRNREAQLAGTLKSLGIDADALFGAPATAAPPGEAKKPERPGLLDRPIANPGAITRGIETAARRREGPDKTVAVVSFPSPRDAAGWRASCPVANVAAPPAPATVAAPYAALGAPARGVSVALPFTKLPTRRLPIHPNGRNELHAGCFVLSKALPDPVDVSGCNAIELTIHASGDLPISVTVATEGAGEARSDVSVHAGTQVVRMDLNAHAQGRWPREKWTGRITAIKLVFWPQDNVYPHPQARDASAALLGVVARSRGPRADELPFAGRAGYLTQCRPNIPHNIPRALSLRAGGGEAAEASGQHERFRTWTKHRVTTPVVAILTGPRPSRGQLDAATHAQAYLRKLCGVALPINPDGLRVGPDVGNVVVVGRRAALAAGTVGEAELRYVGNEGFVLRACNGRIVLAGASDAATLSCLARYLEDHGVRFFQPGPREVVPDMKGQFLHEVIDFDRPYFAERPVAGGWKLRTSAAASEAPGAKGRATRASAMALAADIKDAARAGHSLRPQTVRAAGTWPLHRYVAAKLLWDPFLDASRLIEEFRAPGHEAARHQAH